MDALWLDFRFSLRTLAKSPVASVAVVAILAAAIAVATVLGGFFAAIVYDLPSVDSPESIARVWRADDTRPAGHREPSAEDFLAWKDATRTLTALTAWNRRQSIVGGADGQTVPALFVTSEYFNLTGRTPRLGRPFVQQDFEQPDIAIISDRLWRERFSGDPTIVGRRVSVDVRPREIVGVMPPGFWFPERGIDMWLPLPLKADASLVDIAGRLARDVRMADAQSEFDVLVRRGSGKGPGDRTLVRAVPAEAKVRVRPGLEALVAPAIAILLIACANVGNLLVIRATARQREWAIRAALGATPARLARLSLVETTLFGAGAGSVGLLLAAWGTTLLQLGIASVMPGMAGSVRIGWVTAAIALLATVVTLVGVGLLPALAAARLDVWRSLTGRTGRPLSGYFHYGIGDLLVVLQVGLAVVLVLVTVMLIRTFGEIDRLIYPAASASLRLARVVTPADMARDVRAELGLRLALGAEPWRLVAAAVARDIPLVATGIAVGLTGTLWVTGIVWRDLLMIGATDPRVWIAVCGILGAAGVLASLGPALRAIRVDPVSALRAE